MPVSIRKQNVTYLDKGWQRIMKLFQKGSKSHARVGVLEGKVAPGTSVPATNYAMIAAYNEFGTDTIPARPFIKQTVAVHRKLFIRMLALGAGKMVKGEMTERQVYEELGLAGVKRMRQTIRDAPSWAKPNAPATVAQKVRRSKKLTARHEAGEVGLVAPLIDTGTLRNVIWYDVTIGGKLVT